MSASASVKGRPIFARDERERASLEVGSMKPETFTGIYAKLPPLLCGPCKEKDQVLWQRVRQGSPAGTED